MYEYNYIIFIFKAITNILKQPNRFWNYLKYGVNVIDIYQINKAFKETYKLESNNFRFFFLFSY